MTKLYALPPDHAPSEDILHLVNLDQSKQPLIPRLQLLNWTTSRLSLPWLHLFLSPSISEIHIDLNGGRTTPVNVAVIKALPSIYLKHIAFSNLHTNTEVNTALLDLVCKATRLESVYIQQENDLDHMGPLDDQVEGGREPPELRSLRSITIAFKKEFSFLPSLLDKTTLPSVQQIHLQHLGRTEWLGPDRLFDSMLRSASPDILHALRYTSHYQGMDITSARIQLLRSFVALRTVRVTSSCSSGHCKFFLSDDDISTIATAMPNLVELHLGGTPCASTLVNVSMESLVTLSSNCAKLRDLQTHFDTAGFINRALDVPNEHIPPLQITLKTCQLAQLTVGRIPLPLGRGMDGYWTVGMALLQIFPNLKSIKYHQSTVFGVGDWGEVSRVIKVQRKVANLMSGTSDQFTRVRASNTPLV